MGHSLAEIFNIFLYLCSLTTTRHKFTTFENQVVYAIFFFNFLLLRSVTTDNSLQSLLIGCVRDGAREETEDVQTGTRRAQ